MPKQKIIVCATAYYPFVGGAEIAIEEVARRLSGQFDFFILTARMSRALPRLEMRPEGTIVRLGVGARFDKWLLPILIPYYFSSQFSISDSKFLLWGMDIGQGSFGAVVVKMFCPRLPFILTIQYGESDEYLRRGRFGLIRRGFRAMLARADFVTVISSYLLLLAREHGFCGPAEVIPNGADIEKFRVKNPWPDRQESRIKGNEGKTIITVSRLVAKNGIDILIDAVAEIKKTIPDIRCVIIGDGPERKSYESRIQNHGLEYNIQMMGEIAHTDIAEYLHQADVFVRPSRSEGMGIAFAEAMAAGLPVIGTAVGGIPDIITHERTGLLARPEDASGLAEAIIRLLRNPSFAQHIALAGQEKAAERFGWDGIARAYIRVFLQELGVKKRIVIATGLFPPEIGGPATYSSMLVDALPWQGIGLRVAPFRAVRHFPKIIRHLVYFWKIVFAGRGSDVIFAQDPVSTGMPALLAARIMRKKFILKIVGDYAWEQEQATDAALFETPEKFQTERHGIMTEMRRRIQKSVARAADLVIVPSEYLAGIVRGWGVREEKISVVYNAVAAPEQRMPRDEARKQLGLSGVVIISVGRLVPWKGFALLIDAVADLARESPEICLVIAGSGPEEENLRRRIRERGADGRVRMPGAISHEALMTYFVASDIFVLNSGYEGLSHTLIEAMGAGLPVIATRVGGNPEVITDGKEGTLIAYNDKEGLKGALALLVENSDMRAGFAARARARAAKFTKEKMIRETAMLLKNI